MSHDWCYYVLLSGRERLAEVRDGQETPQVCGQDSGPVPWGLEVQGDEDSPTSSGSLLHWQGQSCCFQSTSSLRSIFLSSFLVNYELLDLLNNQLYGDNLNLTWWAIERGNFIVSPFEKRGLVLCTCRLVDWLVCRPSDVHSISFDPFTWMFLNLVL